MRRVQKNMTENKAKQKLYGGVRGKMKTKTKIHTIDVVPKPGGRGRRGNNLEYGV